MYKSKVTCFFSISALNNFTITKLRSENSRQPLTHQKWNILITMYPIFESNISIKNPIVFPSLHIKHLEIVFILMIGEFKNLFIHRSFFNIGISPDIQDTDLKSSMCLDNIRLKGTVSQFYFPYDYKRTPTHCYAMYINGNHFSLGI